MSLCADVLPPPRRGCRRAVVQLIIRSCFHLEGARCTACSNRHYTDAAVGELGNRPTVQMPGSLVLLSAPRVRTSGLFFPTRTPDPGPPPRARTSGRHRTSRSASSPGNNCCRIDSPPLSSTGCVPPDAPRLMESFGSERAEEPAPKCRLPLRFQTKLCPVAVRMRPASRSTVLRGLWPRRRSLQDGTYLSPDRKARRVPCGIRPTKNCVRACKTDS